MSNIKLIIGTFLVSSMVAGCAALQSKTDEMRHIQDKKDAICQFVSVWAVDNPELVTVKRLCDADASLKEIAAEYAGCKAED